MLHHLHPSLLFEKKNHLHSSPNIMRRDLDLLPIFPDMPSLNIPRQGFPHVERIFTRLVSACGIVVVVSFYGAED